MKIKMMIKQRDAKYALSFRISVYPFHIVEINYFVYFWEEGREI